MRLEDVAPVKAVAEFPWMPGVRGFTHFMEVLLLVVCVCLW